MRIIQKQNKKDRKEKENRADFGYNKFIMSETFSSHRLNRKNFGIIFLIIITIILRLSLFKFESYDYLYAYSVWINFVRSNGYFFSLKEAFTNYTPPFNYLLVLLSYLPVNSLYSIKTVSIIFDYIIAFYVMLIVREKYDSRFISWLSFFAVLFTPTVILNGAVWGQSDSIYASGIIAMLYFLIKKRWGLALLSFSLAFAFKLQSIFLFPLLTVFFLKERKIRKYFALIPLTYLIFILPNYFLGRSFIDLLTIYWHLQINHGYGLDKLTQNAPNIYQWIPIYLVNIAVPIGLFFTFTAVTFIILFINKIDYFLNKELTIKLSVIFSLVIPFFLPRMHERYFFLADLLSIIYAFYFPRFYYVPVIVITVSTLSYLPFLFGIPIHFSILALLLLIVILLLLKDFIKLK